MGIWGDSEPVSKCAFFISICVGFGVRVEVSVGVHEFFVFNDTINDFSGFRVWVGLIACAIYFVV